MLHWLDAKSKMAFFTMVSCVLAGIGWVGYQHMKEGMGVELSANRAKFAIHVAGAVRNPGIVEANDLMLVAEAIEEAGGARNDADLDMLNLAARVIPNTQLYVPKRGEYLDEGRLGVYSAKFRAESFTQSASGTSLININTASKEELESLPGIGPVIAQRIIDYRNQVGSFRSVDQLTEVKGIGQKKLEQIRPFVSL